jgi:hypothetical protein
MELTRVVTGAKSRLATFSGAGAKQTSQHLKQHHTPCRQIRNIQQQIRNIQQIMWDMLCLIAFA